MSANRIEHIDYSQVLYIDTMVALEAKPLSTLPWNEIDPAGPILLLVVPQVNAEIDKRKRDGRLGKRAREFNRLISSAAESGLPARICSGPPAVDIAIAVCDRIDWAALDDLDPEHADARVVGQVLHGRDIPRGRKMLLSHDINPIAMASRHGINVRKMPDHWLLEPEPSPHQKEITRLRGRLKELESTEPELDIGASFGVDAPLQLFRVTPLTEQQRAAIVRHVLAKNPKPAQPKPLFMSPFDYDERFEERYEKYRASDVPRYAETLHRLLETHYSQVPFQVRIENKGHVQTENLVVSLAAVGGTLHNRFVYGQHFGPIAPRPEPFDPIAALSRGGIGPIDYVGRHDMEFSVGPDRGNLIEVHCADFRQGRRWSFDGIAEIDPYACSPFRLELVLTASNRRGAMRCTIELEHQSTSVAPANLIDLGAGAYRVASPMQQKVEAALEAEDWEWFQYMGDEDDSMAPD